MKLLTGLFRACRRKLMTCDNDMGMFRDKLKEIVEKKDSLSDEEVSAKVEELKKLTEDLPDSEDKEELGRFLEDFKEVKNQDAAAAKQAVGPVADLFEKLDTEAMKDVPDGLTTAKDEDVPEEKKEPAEKKPEETADEETVKETVKETEAPDTKETKDDDPNANYSLEEIYQFIKKRMAEDSEAGADELSEKEDTLDEGCGEKDGEEKKEEVTADHAPHIPVTVDSRASARSLTALFEMAKKGGR